MYGISQGIDLKKLILRFLTFQLSFSKQSFDSTFRYTIDNIRECPIFQVGELQLKKIEENTTSSLLAIFKQEEFPEREVIQFINDVNGFARWNIASPFLENNLSFIFANNPEEEFVKGVYS